MSKPSTRRWIAFVVVIAAACLGLAWYRVSSHPHLPAMTAAYKNGDWSRAADLARDRLKSAPNNAEALRIYARATARLGRDGAANAAFARLGSAALEPEDLYLLGVGLSRQGEADKAERVWQRALAVDSEHAETLEQLLRLYSARNRLAEAALVAERLSKLPHWELRGELALGSLRSELNDPLGAAEVQRRALARPDAARLEPGVEAQNRKSLVRNLLLTGRAREARAELTPLLDPGSDVEASWLLSRIALATNNLSEAKTALGAAGTYRELHPLEREPCSYVGEARCAKCHDAIFRAVQASRHSSTLLRGPQLTTLPYPDHPIADPDDPTVKHVFRQERAAVRVETHSQAGVLRAVVRYAFGSPDHYTSLVGLDDRGIPHILRLSHYRSGRESGWVRTTGHSADAGGGHDILGKPLDVADGVHKCLFCHSTNPVAVLKSAGPESADRAIGCERCHGPGALHLAAIDAKFPDRAIIDPRRATAEGRTRLCGQCHAYHGQSSLPRDDSFWIRFQGTALPWSRCFTESGDSLDCMTCHDPHHDDKRKAADFTAVCLQCHKAGAQLPSSAELSPALSRMTKRATLCPVNPTNGCVGCHMPPFRSEPLHATFTDHFIRVHPQANIPKRQ